MAKIIYMEDNPGIRDIVEFKVQNEFPKYDLVMGQSAREGLSQAFGVYLKPSDCSCVDSVVEKLEGTDF